MKQILCNPVSFDEILSKKKSEETDYKPEVWKHMWATMEVMAKERGRISLEYKPHKGGYDSKYAGKWKMTFMGAVYSNADPVKLVEEVTKVFCRVYGIDYEKILADKEAANNGTEEAI